MEINLKKEKINEYEKIFSLYKEKESDKYIPTKELKNVFISLKINVSYNEISEMINEVDRGGDGIIYFSDFLTIINKPINYYTNQYDELYNEFKKNDKLNTGFVSLEKFKIIIKSYDNSLTEDEINGIIGKEDINIDNLINYEEYLRMMNAL